MNSREASILLVGVIAGTIGGLFYPIAVKYVNSIHNRLDNPPKQEFCDWYATQATSDCYNRDYSDESRQKCLDEIAGDQQACLTEMKKDGPKPSKCEWYGAMARDGCNVFFTGRALCLLKNESGYKKCVERYKDERIN